jgi:hypothetical protein
MFTFQLADGKTDDTELNISQHVENEELRKTCVRAVPVALLVFVGMNRLFGNPFLREMRIKFVADISTVERCLIFWGCL